ncbi:MAG: prephenate dehydrogenase/arogenate dehydrogenase family protein [Verrucomicrobiales bacterium]|nr:prephenate dehydrogenase/arogenate dehydrogenase family protein [Verrucomicrobiales bacterium]
MHWRKTAILGVGLLGGSLGLALRKRGLCQEVAGLVRRESAIPEALAAGALDSASMRLEEVVSGADLVVFCTPIAQMPILAQQLAGHLKRGAVVTDVGSVKASVIGALEKVVDQAGGSFVGSHPLAGSERSGVSSARADLFDGAVTVVTPNTHSDAGAGIQVVQLWEAVGSRVVTLDPEIHDTLISRTSHLPHLVAAALAHFVLSPAHPAEQRDLCATGFRDTTRVASGSPEMWRDIAVANRTSLMVAFDGFEHALRELRSAVEAGDGAAIHAFLECSKERRDGWATSVRSSGAE